MHSYTKIIRERGRNEDKMRKRTGGKRIKEKKRRRERGGRI